MNKHFFYIRKVAKILFVQFIICSVISCSTLSAGKKYTLAKVNREKQLIEPHRVFENPNQSDLLDKVNPTDVLSLVLNSGCLPYLQEVGRPEVAIFITTKIRQKDKPNEEVLWEKVYLNSEDSDGFSVINKDSCLPKKDIVILPPIIYDNQDILVSIRIIEMDSADNDRMNAMVSTAASVAATFQPQYAGAISIFQSVLNLIIANNADDIEFQYDFTLSESRGPVTYAVDELYDMVLNPRVGKYAIIKTEHRARQIIPFGYADITQSGIRYGGAEILKFASLGILNWPVWCDHFNGCDYMDLKDPDDIYHKILGRPFAPERDAFIPPSFTSDYLSFQGDNIGNFEVIGDNIKIRQGNELFNFERQAYLIFSVVAGNVGLDVATLQTVANQKKLIATLNINTAQLGDVALKQHLEPVLNSVQVFTAKKQIREECTAGINNSETKDQLIAVQQDCAQQIEEVKKNIYPSGGNAMKLALKSTLNHINSLAKRQLESLGGVVIKAMSIDLITTDIALEVTFNANVYAKRHL